jgi:DNA-binding MarR family transcriptional regulator
LLQTGEGIFFEEMKTFDVTPMQYAALVAIQDRPGIDQRSLSKLVAIDRSTVGTMLRLMERKDLITRTTPPRNQRVKQLLITSAGRKIVRESRAAVAKAQERILEPLDAERRGMFMEQLAKLVDINNGRSRAPLQIGSRKA